MSEITLLNRECLDAMSEMEDNSIDSVVTDPPYGLGFLGKEWDDLPPGKDVFEELLRVLKPGGHLLSFGGSRTYHRMASSVEDAGFEVRDQIIWVYGSGFPKSLDISKGIDSLDKKHAQRERRYKFTGWFVENCELRNSELDRLCGTNTMARHWTDRPPNGKQPDIPVRKYFEKIRPYLKTTPPEWVEEMVDERTVESDNMKEREVVAKRKMKSNPGFGSDKFGKKGEKKEVSITRAKTEQAKAWEGWGTAIKPTHEPIVLARKPFGKGMNTSENCLEWGVGGLDIDSSRVQEGRHPLNLIHDGSEAAASFLGDHFDLFYCAKPTKKERGNYNDHPTVKPLALMEHLIKLVTPKSGTVLDPFCGSGTTGVACKRLGIEAIIIDQDIRSMEIAQQRINEVEDEDKGNKQLKIPI